MVQPRVAIPNRTRRSQTVERKFNGLPFKSSSKVICVPKKSLKLSRSFLARLTRKEKKHSLSEGKKLSCPHSFRFKASSLLFVSYESQLKKFCKRDFSLVLS